MWLNLELLVANIILSFCFETPRRAAWSSSSLESHAADEAPASCPESKADCQKAGFKRTRVEADSNEHRLSLGFDARIFMNSSSTRQKVCLCLRPPLLVQHSSFESKIGKQKKCEKSKNK